MISKLWIKFAKWWLGINEYDEYEMQKFKPFLDRVKKHNGKIETKGRGFRVRFKSAEDEQAYYAERTTSIRKKWNENKHKVEIE